MLLNRMKGHTYGFELALRFEPTDRLKIEASYTYLKMALDLEANSTASRGQVDVIEGLAAPHQASLRTGWDLPNNFEVDATLRYVDELVALDYDAYTELDLSLTWRPTEQWEFSLVGQNLLDDHHFEQDFAFSATGLPTEVERGGYVKATFSF
jgi:iron complex outermembrane receptor protein